MQADNLIGSYMMFKGKPLLNYTLMIFIFGMLLLGILTNLNKGGVVIFFILSGIGITTLLSSRVYYFGLSNKHLIIQNHNVFWMKKRYQLDEIIELSFERPSKMPGCIRVTGKNYKTKLFPASTLSDKDWIRFKEELEKRDIPITDKFVSSIVFYEFVLFDEIKEIFSRFNKK